MLWFSTFAKIQYTGPAIALSLAIALIASLTLAPVLLHWLRGAVFWPFRQPHHDRGAPTASRRASSRRPMSGFWIGVADLVVRCPGLILAISVLALTPLAVIGARTKANYSQLADLNPDQPSVVGAQIVQRYFAVGELGPTTRPDRPPRARLPLATRARRRSTSSAGGSPAIPNVAEVRSVSQPLGKPSAVARRRRRACSSGSIGRPRRRGRSRQRATSASTPDRPADLNHITRIDVVFKTDPSPTRACSPGRYCVEPSRTRRRRAGRSTGHAASGVAGSTAAGRRPQEGHDQRRAADVRPGDARGLR